MGPKGTKKAAKEEPKAKADKPKSKRALSPYIVFCSEKRPELKAAHPNASFGELGKMLGQLWAQMDEKAKAVSIFCIRVSNLLQHFSIIPSLTFFSNFLSLTRRKRKFACTFVIPNK